MSETLRSSSIPTEELDSCVQQFLGFEKALDQAYLSKDKVQVQEATEAIQNFYGILKPEDQLKIRSFIEQQNAGKRLDFIRGNFNRNVNGILGRTAAVLRTSVENIPRIAEDGTTLIVGTAVSVVRGLYKGIVNPFKQAA